MYLEAETEKALPTEKEGLYDTTNCMVAKLVADLLYYIKCHTGCIGNVLFFSVKKCCH